MLDADFAAEQLRLLEADLARARRVTPAQWLAHPWRERVAEALASVIGTQL